MILVVFSILDDSMILFHEISATPLEGASDFQRAHPTPPAIKEPEGSSEQLRCLGSKAAPLWDGGEEWGLRRSACSSLHPCIFLSSFGLGLKENKK